MEIAQKVPPIYVGDLIKEGFYDKLVIIGYPYDIGAKKCGAKGGQDYGPDSFRRFVKDIGSICNPEYDFLDISIGLPQISDYGNIQIHPPPYKPSQKEVIEKLSTKISLCIKRQNIPFIIGGTRDQTYALAKAIQPQKKSLLILFRSQLDLKETSEAITQDNSLTQILSLPDFSQHHQVLIIGPKQEVESEKKIQQITIKDLRNHQEDLQTAPSMMDPITQGGQLFHKILKDAQSDSSIDQIVVSMSMECIENVMGVSTRCSQGITTEEAVEIFKLAGYYGHKIVALDICDYNPFIEDWSTGRLLATMFYYFVLGLSARLEQK